MTPGLTGTATEPTTVRGLLGLLLLLLLPAVSEERLQLRSTHALCLLLLQPFDRGSTEIRTAYWRGNRGSSMRCPPPTKLEECNTILLPRFFFNLKLPLNVQIVILLLTNSL